MDQQKVTIGSVKIKVHVQPKTFKLGFSTKIFILNLAFVEATTLCPPHQVTIQSIMSYTHRKKNSMAEGGAYKPDVIEVADDDPVDFPNSGPQNPAEAQTY